MRSEIFLASLPQKSKLPLLGFLVFNDQIKGENETKYVTMMFEGCLLWKHLNVTYI
jgi:hypothetical protein